MKKTILFLSLLFIVNITTAQNLSGEVLYKKEVLKYLSEDEDWLKKNEKDPVFIRNVTNIDKNGKFILEDLKFQLVFNKSESIFKVGDFLELEKNRFFRSALGPEGSCIYYNNVKNDEHIK